MSTWNVMVRVKTGRRRIDDGDDEYPYPSYDMWSMSYIRERLYELCHDRVTWGVAWSGRDWDGRAAGVRQLIWRLADPPESKDDEEPGGDDQPRSPAR